jgi:hypothetical protein
MLFMEITIVYCKNQIKHTVEKKSAKFLNLLETKRICFIYKDSVRTAQ